ncbi:MAG: MASE1 domain-containing protein [Bdellovibrionales bacterium]|nr:MASE1 domain-containing protein [Bdellovibrionales bacterium]
MTYLMKLGLLCIAYYATARFGLSIGAVNKFATLFWPPTGASLAVLILGGRSLWPAIFIGAFAANFMTGAPLLAALGIACGNSLEALLGAAICSRARGFQISLDRVKDVGVFILGAGLASTLASPIIGVLSLWFSGTVQRNQILATFGQWWVGDIISNLVIAPLILVLFSKPGSSRFFWAQVGRWERLILSFLLIGMSELVLDGTWGVSIAPFMGHDRVYILIPFLLWGAIRFGQRGAVLVTFIISTIAVWNASSGLGPFSGGPGTAHLFQLISFVIVISVTGLILGAVISERENERTTLELSRASLQKLTEKLQFREAELERARDAAESASAAKTAFLANMSHEIRTPLGAILGFSELILNSEMDAPQKAKSIEVIKRNGKLLSNIIDDILDLSKVEAGRMDVERIDVSLDEVVVDMTSLLYAEAARKGLEMKIFAEGPVPATVKTDPLRLRQILLNVVGNAIKFTRQGHIYVKIKLSRVHGGKEALTFVVEDTGRGIAEDEKGKLFSPFSQSDVSTTRKYGGTGLGLILSRKFAQALGGDLVLSESTFGQGSTFTIFIDPGELRLNNLSCQLLGHPHPEVSESSQQVVAVQSRPQPLAMEEPLKILLVDDSDDNQILMKQVLLKAGAGRVDVAVNGVEAVQRATAESYDIILMDIQMPEMDGMTATRILRDQGYTNPIVALTAHAMIEERRKCLAGGFDEHLCKPVEVKAMIQLVSQIVVRNRKKRLSVPGPLSENASEVGLA